VTSIIGVRLKSWRTYYSEAPLGSTHVVSLLIHNVLVVHGMRGVRTWFGRYLSRSFLQWRPPQGFGASSHIIWNSMCHIPSSLQTDLHDPTHMPLFHHQSILSIVHGPLHLNVFRTLSRSFQFSARMSRGFLDA